MKGLSNEIETSLEIIIEGLGYDIFPEEGVSGLEPEKMKSIMQSKVSSFNSAKTILNRWIGSPNSPDNLKIKNYLERLVHAGEIGIKDLRKALADKIDFDTLKKHQFDAAIKAKPLILEAIFDLDYSIKELRDKLESEDFVLTDREFKLGYPERFSKGEFYPIEDYHQDPVREDLINICPLGTEGKVIELGDLKIQLPKVPEDKSKILFSDLPKKEQYWRRSDIPPITVDNVDLWEDYIKEEFRKRREGVWFMNYGKPTYLTGSHYFALQFCKMLDNGGYMDFRVAQQNIFYHIQACVVDPRCLGQHFTKSRRTGFTYAVLFLMLNYSTSTRNNNFGITSKSDTDASKAFLKYRYGLMNLPFYFKPVIYGKVDSTKQFNFSAPADNTRQGKKSKKNNMDDYLNNHIDYEPTKTDSYDGQAMYMYLGDESGKWKKPNDYIEHWGTVAPTMLEGGIVVGKAFIGSTVGAMKEGGSQFKELYDASDVKKRNEVTQMTSSGLYRYFLPAQENMTGHTDRYGVCHQVKPKNKTLNIKGNIIRNGSIDYLISQEESKKSENDRALNAQYRAFPRTIDHAYRDDAKGSIFNVTKIYDQLEYNETLKQEEKYTIGNFRWENGVVDSKVEFHPDSAGRFKVAWLPSVADGTEHLANRVKTKNDLFYPLNENLVRFGCDPFSLKSTHGKGSNGALHGLTMPLSEGNSPNNKFVVEYIARPPDETIFFEDVIKCIRFYGSPILVESNKIGLLRHMRNRGYRGFSMNRLDKVKLNENEKEYGGQTMSGQSTLDSHMNAIGFWIQKYVGIIEDDTTSSREGSMGDMVYEETLRDWLHFDPAKRTDFDATISSGLAIMACQESKYKKPVKKRAFNISDLGLVKKYSKSYTLGS